MAAYLISDVTVRDAAAIIVVEFADLERARTWYRSPEYAEAFAVRDKALSRNLILVDSIGI